MHLIRRGFGILAYIAVAGCTSASPTPTETSDVLADGATTDAPVDVEASTSDTPLEGGVYTPTAADVSLKILANLPKGESILFNDRNATPESLETIRPDGSGNTKLAQAFTVWSLGATESGNTIAISVGDPKQKEHFGVEIGDAIQQTWLLDLDKRSASNLSSGNVNDECHLFGASAEWLYVCRRSDFKADGTFRGYGIGRIALKTGRYEPLGREVPGEMGLTPYPSADESSLIYTVVQVKTNARSLRKIEIPAAGEEEVRAQASNAVFSPDRSFYVFTNTSDSSRLHRGRLGIVETTKLTESRVTSVHFNRDGKQLVYLLWDDKNSCSHIEIIASDGSSKTPTRIHDCSERKSFVTGLAWVTR